MYTEKDLQSKFNLSANALKTRIRHLKLKPTKGDRGKNLYDDSQLLLLAEQHEHLASGGTLESFAPAIAVELAPIKTSKLVKVKQSTVDLGQFISTCEDLSFGDPFWDYELLQRASDKSMYLPTEKLAVIMGKTPSSFSSKKSFTHQGFVMVRQDDRSGNSYVWSINANQ